MIEDLFDKSNEELLVHFKTIVATRDNTRRHHNLLCKPFSEFDTSHFKKISYSYYEMPPEFPRPLCLGKQDLAFGALYRAVLNDDYSSLPQGSESFKFKTKNQYEEILFKTEDDMYKIDFEIGNIFNTLKVLQDEKEQLDRMNQTEKDSYKLNEKKFNNLRKL